MKMETIVLNRAKNVTLTAYLQAVGGEFPNIPKRPAMLVLPGGGYQMCSDREADPIALKYAQAGYQAFILRYSVGKDCTWPDPLNDYEQAMEMIRSKANEWNLYPDKVAVVGFSAGGHLAACAATMAKNRPNAAILVYPATMPDIIDMCLAGTPDLFERIDDQTCPCFVAATRNDRTVPVQNSLKFLAALEEKNIAFESHIYAYGPHGFSLGETSTNTPGALICSRVPRWAEDSLEWLKDVFGDFGNGSMTEPVCKQKVFGDFEEYLSIDCSLATLFEQKGKARFIMAPVIPVVNAFLGNKPGRELMLKAITMRDYLGYVKAPKKVFENTDAKLKKIRNQLYQQG